MCHTRRSVVHKVFVAEAVAVALFKAFTMTTSNNALDSNVSRETSAPVGAPESEAFHVGLAVFDTGLGSQASQAARDITQGLANYPLWTTIGWRDVKQRYRRSTLGPFWVTLSMAFMVIGLGIVYSAVFNTPMSDYLPFVCLGLILWEFISRSILEGSIAFLTLEGLIKQIRLPLTTHIVSILWRNTVVLAHNAAIYVVVLVIFGINPVRTILWFIPGFVLVWLNLVWLLLILATLCARFRDMPLIVQSVVQMLFFVTPVFWSPSVMVSRTVLVDGNPFYYMLELLRAPLLGTVPTAHSWIAMLLALVIGWTVTFVVFAKFRRRIPYWL